MFISKYIPENVNRIFADQAERNGGSVPLNPSAWKIPVATNKRKIVEKPSETERGIPFTFSHSPNGIAIRANTIFMNG